MPEPGRARGSGGSPPAQQAQEYARSQDEELGSVAVASVVDIVLDSPDRHSPSQKNLAHAGGGKALRSGAAADAKSEACTSAVSGPHALAVPSPEFRRIRRESGGTGVTSISNGALGVGVRAMPGAVCASSTSSQDGLGIHGFWAAAFNFVNSIVGAGIIGLAFALEQSGFWLGMVLMLFCAGLTDCSVRLLVRIGAENELNSYEDVCLTFLGRLGRQLVGVSMFLFAFGAMLAYLIIIADTVPTVLRHWTGVRILGSRTVVLAVTAVCICLPLSSLRDIGHLAGTSAVSIVAVFVIIAIVTVRAPAASEDQGIHFEGPARQGAYAFSHGKVFQSFGTMAFAYVCHHSSYLVRGSMKRPAQWDKVTHVSIGLATVLSIALSSVGYLSFMRCTRPDILNNFLISDEAINAARVLLAVTMFFTYPMEFFVARQALNTMAFGSEEISWLRHWAATGVIFLTSLAIALWLKADDLATVLSLNGGTCASIVGFILPSLCYFSSEQQACPSLTWRQLLLAWDAVLPVLLMVVGVVALVMNAYYAISEAAQGGLRMPEFCNNTNNTDI